MCGLANLWRKMTTLLITTEDNRLLNLVSFRDASVTEENNTYKLDIRGILEGSARTNTCPVAKFDEEEDAVEALRSLRDGVKKGEWDAKEFKEKLSSS